MKLGLAADHGGIEMKQQLANCSKQKATRSTILEITFVIRTTIIRTSRIPLARAVSRGDVERGILLCGSGVGASVAANKISACGPRSATMIFHRVKESRMTT